MTARRGFREQPQLAFDTSAAPKRATVPASNPSAPAVCDSNDVAYLAALLINILPKSEATRVACVLVDRFGSAEAAIAASPERLYPPGVPESATGFLGQLHALSARLAHGRVLARTVLNSTTAVTEYCRVKIGYRETECFHILYLDQKNQLIADEVFDNGTINHIAIYPREIVIRALHRNCAGVIIAHNHPSGDPSPSRSDIEMTKALVAALKAIDVVIHDHLIVGRGEVASFKSLGLIS